MVLRREEDIEHRIRRIVTTDGNISTHKSSRKCKMLKLFIDAALRIDLELLLDLSFDLNATIAGLFYRLF